MASLTDNYMKSLYQEARGHLVYIKITFWEHIYLLLGFYADKLFSL